MTAAYLAERELVHVELCARHPGGGAAAAVRCRPGARRCGSCWRSEESPFTRAPAPVELVDGELRLVPEGTIAADRVVALPRLRGAADRRPAADGRGVPPRRRARSGARSCGRVRGRRHHQLPGQAGRNRCPAGRRGRRDDRGQRRRRPRRRSRFRPVLRGLLLTGRQPRYPSGTNSRAAGAMSRRPVPSRSGGRRRRSSAATWRPSSAPSPASRARPRRPPLLAPCRSRSRSTLPESRSWRRCAWRQRPMLKLEGGAHGGRGHGRPSRWSLPPRTRSGRSSEKMRAGDLGSAARRRLRAPDRNPHLTRPACARSRAASIPSEARVREWMTAEPSRGVSQAPRSRTALLADGRARLPPPAGRRTASARSGCSASDRSLTPARPVRARNLTHNVGAAGSRASRSLCGKPATRSTAMYPTTCGQARAPQSSARPTF